MGGRDGEGECRGEGRAGREGTGKGGKREGKGGEKRWKGRERTPHCFLNKSNAADNIKYSVDPPAQ